MIKEFKGVLFLILAFALLMGGGYLYKESQKYIDPETKVEYKNYDDYLIRKANQERREREQKEKEEEEIILTYGTLKMGTIIKDIAKNNSAGNVIEPKRLDGSYGENIGFSFFAEGEYVTILYYDETNLSEKGANNVDSAKNNGYIRIGDNETFDAVYKDGYMLVTPIPNERLKNIFLRNFE